MRERQRNRVHNLFTCLAPEYDAHYVVPRCVAENSLLQRTIARMLPVQDGVQPWPPRILDLGCGTGLGADLLKAETLRQPYGKRGTDLRSGYVGVDMCEQMLVRARRKHPGSRFIHGDIVGNNCGQFGQVYDLVLCLYVLNYVPRPRDVLKGIERALRIHGKALLVLCSRRWQPPEPSMGVSDLQWRKPDMWLASNWQIVAMTTFLKTLGVHRVWGFSYLPHLVDRLDVPQSVLSKYVQLEAATLGRWREEDGQYMVVEMENLP